MLHTQTLVNIVINLCNISFYIISERALCFSKKSIYNHVVAALGEFHPLPICHHSNLTCSMHEGKESDL